MITAGLCELLVEQLPEYLHVPPEELRQTTGDALRAAYEAIRGDRRAAFLRNLFTGALSPSALAEAAASHGLDPDVPYQAFRAHVPDAETRRRLESSTGEVGLTGDFQGDLAGMLHRPPRTLRADDLIAVGQPLPLAAAAESFSQASATLRVAAAHGLRGVVSITEVTVQAAVLALPGYTDIVVDRCFGVISRSRSPHQRALFEETLTALIDNNLHINETAEALHVHPNTLRYRLKRYEELTGLAMDLVSDVVTVWWALQRIRVTEG